MILTNNIGTIRILLNKDYKKVETGIESILKKIYYKINKIWEECSKDTDNK
jgi:hypothetical protein